MRILTISHSDMNGGASIAAYRLHQEFLRIGIESKMLVGQKFGSCSEVSEIIPKSKILNLINRIIYKFFHQISIPNTYYLSTYFIKRNPLVTNWADVIILRNVHGDYLSENILPFLTKYSTVLWRLPDMWAMTGHCVYSMDCEKWKTGCGSCPDLETYYPLRFDTSKYLWNRKRKIYKKSRFKVIAPSHWLKNIIEQSPLLQTKETIYIPTGVNINTFFPLDKIIIRKEFSISNSALVIMFGSHQVNDPRKGGNLIPTIIDFVQKRIQREIIILTIGLGFLNLEGMNVKHIHLGKINNDVLMNKIYNLADVYAFPVLADNLPNTLVEASAAGIPSIVFDVGGCSEIVVNGKSGLVVEKNNIEKFGLAILQLLLDSEIRNKFSNEAREIAKEKYNMNKQANSYIKLINETIS